MKSELERTQQRIEKITKRLEKELGLDQWWVIHHNFVEGFDGDTMVGANHQISVDKTRAVTTTTWQYREAKISWYLGMCVSSTDDELEEVAVHEYVHVLNSPLVGMIPIEDASPLMSSAQQAMVEQLSALHSQIDEFVTESLSRVILRAKGWDTPV